MKYATLNPHGAVAVVYLYDPRPGIAAIAVPEGVFAGFRQDAHGNWVPPPAAEAVKSSPPDTISRRQCAAELFAENIITGPEAIAMTATGTPPAVIEAILAAIPEPDQTFARLEFAASTYERTNQLICTVMAALGKSADDRDAFFLAANAR